MRIESHLLLVFFPDVVIVPPGARYFCCRNELRWTRQRQIRPQLYDPKVNSKETLHIGGERIMIIAGACAAWYWFCVPSRYCNYPSIHHCEPRCHTVLLVREWIFVSRTSKIHLLVVPSSSWNLSYCYNISAFPEIFWTSFKHRDYTSNTCDRGISLDVPIGLRDGKIYLSIDNKEITKWFVAYSMISVWVCN